jgi:hypothetical protein
MDGVGIVLEFHSDSDYPTVSSLVPGKSANACGIIKIGDVLKSVDRISTQKKTFDEIRSMIAGPVGTYVSLSFQGSQGAYECEKLLRGNVNDSIQWSTHASPSTLPAAATSSALPSDDLFGTNEVRKVWG